MSPLIIAVHRFLWPGLVLLPLAARDGFGDIRRLGWLRAGALTLFGGLPLAVLSYAGFLLVPLAHGGVIQPSCASLGGLLLASFVLREPLPARRIAGALAMVVGLIIIGTEALRTIGTHGLIGDLMYVAAGCSFATFGMLLRRWRLEPMPAVAVTGILSLLGLPILLIGIGNPADAGFAERSFASNRARRVRRRWRDLFVHPRRRASRRVTRGGVSGAGAAFHVADRLFGAGHCAERLSARGVGSCPRRLPADATGLRRTTPPCGSRETRRCAPARAKCFVSNWRTTPACSLRRALRSPGRQSARCRRLREAPRPAALPSSPCA